MDLDEDYDSINFPLIQAACAFCVLQFFFPFMGLIGHILCVVVFAIYSGRASNKVPWNVLISMAILTFIGGFVGEIVFVLAYVAVFNCVLLAGTNYFGGGDQVTQCVDDVGFTGVGWAMIWIGFVFAIVETVYIFDLHNAIRNHRFPMVSPQVIVVAQSQPIETVVQTTTVQQPVMMQPGMMQPGMMQPGMMQPGMMQPQPVMMQQPMYVQQPGYVQTTQTSY